MKTVHVEIEALEKGGIRAICKAEGHEPGHYDSQPYRQAHNHNDKDNHAYISAREYADIIGRAEHDCTNCFWNENGTYSFIV